MCYSEEKDVSKLNFPEVYWMKGIGLPNMNYFVPGSNSKGVEWIPPTAKKAKKYDIEVLKGFVLKVILMCRKPLSLKETMTILQGEGALNIRVLNMRNHSSMAAYMLFVTGSSLNHEKRIGDTLVHYVEHHLSM